MQREHQKWYSPALGREMELLVFGHYGRPLLVFPSAQGRFFDYESNHMIETLRGHDRRRTGEGVLRGRRRL
jgi:esterase/lipase superfamily enzyme